MNRYIQWYHSDVNELKCGFKPLDTVEKSIVVSKYAKKGTDAFYGIDSDIIYNELNPNITRLAKEPIGLKKADLKLVTVSRLTEDKGMSKMYDFAKQLKNRGIKFVWYMVGSFKNYFYEQDMLKKFSDIPEVIFVGNKINPYPYIRWCDYGVVLSKRETWNMFTNECLALGKPVIASNFEVIHEQITHGKNGYIFEDEIDIDLIYKRIPEVNYTPSTDYMKWYNLLK